MQGHIKEYLAKLRILMPNKFGWDIEEKPIYTDPGNNDRIPGYKAIVRDDNSKVLGVVSTSYNSITNEQIDGVANDLEKAGCNYVDHGEFAHGKRVWMQFENKILPEVNVGTDSKPDMVKSLLMIASGHGGIMSFQFISTLIRIVCLNTYYAALRDGDRLFTIKHTSSSSDRIMELKDYIGQVAESTIKILDQYRALNTPIPTKDPIRDNPYDWFAELFSYEKKARPVHKDKKIIAWTDPKYSGKASNNIGALYESYYDSGAMNTYWGLFNAVTDFVDHKVNSKKDDYSVFGRGQYLKTLALENLTERVSPDWSLDN